ncbi:group II intron reverse transcriptase/maturase [Acidobacteriota bacterium]
MSGRRQKTQYKQLRLAFASEVWGDTPDADRRGTEPLAAKRRPESPATEEPLMEEVCDRKNLEIAWKRVRGNKGSPGVDGLTIDETLDYLREHWPTIREQLLKGTYAPQPVKRVEIPKPAGGVRKLGVPTVSDRIAQMVAKLYLEPMVEPQFHPDSYGYRPGKSAHDAVGAARQRCWRYDWVIDLDIQGFFDNLDHALTMRAVGKYTQTRWILLYVKRWLEAPVQQEDGSTVPRTKGTPQGGVISPLLANIFLHLTFDNWMRETYPEVPFERYADDIVAHCEAEKQAHRILSSIQRRLQCCRLKAHPEKTKIVYCKDDDRRRGHYHEKFDFLGYTFRPRRSKNRWGKSFINFSPAASNEAAKKMRQEMRRWRLPLRSDKAIDDLARMWNPVFRGWIQYYGRFYKSALYPVFRHLNGLLVKWAMRKYKRLRRHRRRAEYWLGGIACREPRMFAHWHLLGVKPAAG